MSLSDDTKKKIEKIKIKKENREKWAKTRGGKVGPHSIILFLKFICNL